MTEYSRDELERAYQWFKIKCEIEEPCSLKEVRLARQQSMRMVANKLQMSAPAYCQLEKRAQRGAITIRQLTLMANVLDCDLKISFRSKLSDSFLRDVWNQLLPYALQYGLVLRSTSPVRWRLLTAVVLKDCLPHPEIRRRLVWARKAYQQWPRYLNWDKHRWPYTI
jgi:transcriptional regulator with XRE-family HTH domain